MFRANNTLGVSARFVGDISLLDQNECSKRSAKCLYVQIIPNNPEVFCVGWGVLVYEVPLPRSA